MGLQFLWIAKAELLIIFVWRSAKVERIYLNEYSTIKELNADVKDYISFYNHKRFHQTLDYKKPMSFYYDSLKINNKDYNNLVAVGA